MKQILFKYFMLITCVFGLSGCGYLLSLGQFETTKGDCGIFCYSHSSYFAEVPEQYQRDEDGNIKMENGKPVETENWKDYTKKWGVPKIGADGKYINHAIPKLVNPNNPNGEKYETNPF